MFSKLKNLSLNQFTFVTALVFVCVYNLSFFDIVRQGLAKQEHVNYAFVASIPILLTLTLSFVFSLFSVKYLVKPFFIVLVLLSSSVSFAALKYGVVFDTGMIENTIQTNPAEASMYLNVASIVNFLLTGMLPAFLIYKVNIVYKPFSKELLHKFVFMVTMLLGVGIIAFFYFQNYVAFGRNNDEIKRYLVPTYFIGSTAKYINTHYLQKPLVFKELGLDAVNRTDDKNGKPNLVVMVVGETARSMNYAYYGYDKPTNAHTASQDLMVFNDVSSCGTATAVSLPCMFSNMTRETYDSRRAKAQDSAVDVLQEGKVHVQWFDNDSGCKGVCDRVEHLMIDLNSDPELCSGEYCFDQVLLNQLDSALAAAKAQDTFIVLHIIGSHGPTYYLRYPPEHRKFVPDCQRSDIQNCTNEELVNTYDNTILYSDYIMSQVVEKLTAVNDKYDTAMLYVSDHGESLGEKGMYLHGAPYSIAPKEQTSIPMLAWFSPSFSTENGIDLACLSAKAQQGGYSHDNIYHSIIGLMNIHTKDYSADLDLFSTCRVK